MPCITKKELLQVGKYLQIKKVLGPDQTSNKVIKVIIPRINNYLVYIFNNFLFIGYYPLHFKESIVVILHKYESTRDYINLKSYWPINLLIILKKIMEVVLIARISYMATTYHLLPKIYFKGQHGSYIQIAIYHFLENLYKAWNEDKITFFLIMNVSVAYFNTSH